MLAWIILAAQEADAERERIFAPSPQYLRAVPFEQAEMESHISYVIQSGSPSGVSGCASTARMSGGSCGGSASVFAGLCTETCGSSKSPSPMVSSLVTWCGEGSLPVPELEVQAQSLLEEWKITKMADNVYMHSIPLERENEALNEIRRKICVK